MKEQEKLEKAIKNLTYIMIIGFVFLALLIIGLYFRGDNTASNDNKTTTTDTSKDNTTTYDVSKMNKVDVDGAMDLFEKKGTQVLYIGRSDCSVCVKLVPILNQVQSDLKFTTNYFDLNSTNNFQKEMADLAKKFTPKATVNGTTDTIGNLFISKGYTPTVVIIKDGKVVDGFIGYKDANTYKELVKKYL